MSRKKKKAPLDASEDFATPAKQERLAGMQDAAIEEIEEAARNVKHWEQRRLAFLAKEMDARALLLAVMKKHGRAAYHYHGIDVTTTETVEKAKVKFYEEDGSDAVSHNTNPGGADSQSEESAPAGDQEQPEVAGASTEANQEAGAAGAEAGGEDESPF